MAGLNGLPSVIGLDGSLSDIGTRKKYPFELEKAIHNVMFIQHHMQRQDEFDAVSILENSVRIANVCSVRLQRS
jgi:nicotinic acetylcholine receptor